MSYVEIFCSGYNDDAIQILVKVRAPSLEQEYELWGGVDELSRLYNVLHNLPSVKISEVLSFSIGSLQRSYAGDFIKISFKKISDVLYLIEFEGKRESDKDRKVNDFVTFQVKRSNLDRFSEQVRSISKEPGIALLE